MKQRLYYSYPIKIWLTTILVSPALFLPFISGGNFLSHIGEYLALAAAFAVIGIFACLPALVLYWGVYNLLAYSRWQMFLKVPVLIGMAAVLEWIILDFIYNRYAYAPSNRDGFRLLYGCYVAGLLIAHICFSFSQSKIGVSKDR